MAGVTTLLHTVDNVMTQCPWTQVKTATQLCAYAKSEVTEIEEELKAAARGEDKTAAIVGEVGDLIFDALLLAMIVERDFPGATLRDMLIRVAKKVQRRCPHVFAGEKCETPAQAAEIWQREKSKEKAKDRVKDLQPRHEASKAGGSDRIKPKRSLDKSSSHSNENPSKKQKA